MSGIINQIGSKSKIVGGDVGIGTSSPGYKLHVYGSGTQYMKIESTDGVASHIIDYEGSNNGGMIMQKDGTQKFIISHYGVDDTLRFASDSAGNVGKFASGGDFYTNDGSVSSLSDFRVKKDIEDLTDGLDIVNQLRPRTYKFNGAGEMTGNDNIKRYGFIADEVLSVASHYVQVEKGKVDGVAVDDFKSMSQTRLIPMLTKAIQELSAKNDALEARVTALE
jgi:hypothetical protein